MGWVAEGSVESEAEMRAGKGWRTMRKREDLKGGRDIGCEDARMERSKHGQIGGKYQRKLEVRRNHIATTTL